MESKTVLRYIGKGAFLDGVPARDLTVQDIEERGLDEGVLLASGLYEHASTKRKRVRNIASK